MKQLELNMVWDNAFSEIGPREGLSQLWLV
jgi:hypothetical protein